MNLTSFLKMFSFLPKKNLLDFLLLLHNFNRISNNEVKISYRTDNKTTDKRSVTRPKMLRQVTFVALTFFSFSEALRGTVKLGHKVSQPPAALRSDAYPEQFHDQILDHFDATNPG